MNNIVYYKNLMEIQEGESQIEVKMMNRDDFDRIREMKCLTKIIKSIQNYKDYDYFE